MMIMIGTWIRHYGVLWILLALVAGLAIGLAGLGPALAEDILTGAWYRVWGDSAYEEKTVTWQVEVGEGEVAAEDRVVGEAVADFGVWSWVVNSWGEWGGAVAWEDGRLRGEERIDFRFYRDDGWRERVELVAGAWPEVGLGAEMRVPVVVGEGVAKQLGVVVGDLLPISRRFTDVEPEIWLEVVGVGRPREGDDDWWGEQSPWRAYHDGSRQRFVMLIADEATAWDILERVWGEEETTVVWRLQPEVVGMSWSEMGGQQEAFEAWLQVIGGDGRVVVSALPALLEAFAVGATAVRMPLAFLLATTALIALGVVVMSGQVAHFLLRDNWHWRLDRGWWRGWLQVEWLGMMVGVVMVGWGTAVIGLRLVLDSEMARWPQMSWLFMGVASCVSWLMLSWPIRGVGVRRERERLAQASWWQLWYVDIIAFGAGVLLLNRYRDLGGLVGVEGEGIDWLTILGPLLTLFGGLALLARLLPLLLAGWRMMSRPLGSATLYLASSYAANQGGQAIRVVLLVTLTVALGILSGSLDSTLLYNEAARARYAVGAAERLIGVGEVEGEGGWSPAWRGEGSFEAFVTGRISTFEVLAIDVGSWREVAMWSEFLGEEGDDALGALAAGRGVEMRGIPIDDEGELLSLWLGMPTKEALDWQGVEVEVKLVDGGGGIGLYGLVAEGERVAYETGEWRRYEVDLPAGTGRELHSIWFRSRRFQPDFRQNMALDNVVAAGADGHEQVLTSFEDGGDWFSIGNNLYVIPSIVAPQEGSRRLEMGVGRFGVRGQWYGVAPYGYAQPHGVVPAIVSGEWAATNGVGVGDVVAIRVRLSVSESLLRQVRVAAVVDYFPTLYELESQAGFVVMPLDSLLVGAHQERRLAVEANEVWWRGDGGVVAEGEGIVARLTPADISEQLRTYPLAVGLRQASRWGYWMTLVVTIIGLTAHIVLSWGGRQQQLAIGQALGFRRRELLWMLGIELFLLILIGFLLGMGLGYGLSWGILTNFNFDWGGLALAPPFVLRWSLTPFYQSGGVVIFILLVSLLLGSIWLGRQQLVNQLRVWGD
ncbi:MAG TPA: FtsX-like permease family protein [Anaerolineae bacterium]|nr:FtsX-like permease family protein [Anaerolineae bacterium]